MSKQPKKFPVGTKLIVTADRLLSYSKHCVAYKGDELEVLEKSDQWEDDIVYCYIFRNNQKVSDFAIREKEIKGVRMFIEF